MKRLASFVFAAAMCASLPVHAQASRTWVSGVGDDANPCSRTAPCKTFAGAISKTAAKGEIDALDPGGFGTVTITKSITIDGGQALAGILSSGVNGIVINTAASDTVILRNLDINGWGTGVNGIRFVGSGHLLVDRVRIWNTTGFGIEFAPNGDSTMTVTDSVIHTHAKAGIAVTPVAPATATATVGRTTLEHNASGIKVLENGSVTIRDSVLANNSAHGLFANSTTLPARIYGDNLVISNNKTTGVFSTGAQAQATVAESVITLNALGVQGTVGGQVLSYGNNRLTGNVSAGAFTSTVTTH